MAEIWNLNALCRCCHKDGYFRSLQYPYVCNEGGVEIYADWLQETFGITMVSASVAASIMICEECIVSLKDARAFKQQVTQCELKFRQYCMNEEAVKMESDDGEITENKLHSTYEYETKKIKVEFAEQNDDHFDHDHFDADNLDILDHDEAKVTPSSSVTQKADKRKATKAINKTKRTQRVRQSITATTKRRKTEVKAEIKTETVEAKALAQIQAFNCKDCDAVYSSGQELSKHIDDRHGLIPPTWRLKNMRKCEVCYKLFGVGVYKQHMRSWHPEEWAAKVPVKCEQCGIVQIDDEALKKHIAMRHSRHICEFCGMSFELRSTLRLHVSAEHDSFKRYTCDYCQKDFKTRPVLTKHILWHMGKKRTVACSICCHRFNDKTQMQIHVKQVHENVRAYQCEFCPKNYKAKKVLMDHLRVKHSTTLQYKCDECHKAFPTQKELNRHRHWRMKSETEKTPEEKPVRRDRSYRCPICLILCRGRGSYRRHLNKVHKGHLPYTCHVCGNTFASKYVLDRHILSHVETKESVCELCNKAFKHQIFLQAHMKRIHGEKHSDGTWKIPIAEYVKCNICKLKVRDIEKHIERHKNRPHKCSECDRAYSQRNALNRHVKDVHLKQYRYRCDLCPARFIKWITVRRHKKKKHTEEYNSGNKSATIEPGSF